MFRLGLSMQQSLILSTLTNWVCAVFYDHCKKKLLWLKLTAARVYMHKELLRRQHDRHVIPIYKTAEAFPLEPMISLATGFWPGLQYIWIPSQGMRLKSKQKDWFLFQREAGCWFHFCLQHLKLMMLFIKLVLYHFHHLKVIRKRKIIHLRTVILIKCLMLHILIWRCCLKVIR